MAVKIWISRIVVGWQIKASRKPKSFFLFITCFNENCLWNPQSNVEIYHTHVPLMYNELIISMNQYKIFCFHRARCKHWWGYRIIIITLNWHKMADHPQNIYSSTQKWPIWQERALPSMHQSPLPAWNTFSLLLEMILTIWLKHCTFKNPQTNENVMIQILECVSYCNTCRM